MFWYEFGLCQSLPDRWLARQRLLDCQVDRLWIGKDQEGDECYENKGRCQRRRHIAHHYMAPELFGLKPKYSQASDVYAFALMAW
jgi:hypothetical protein